MAKKTPDWERIELDYRAGIKSLREIASGSGTSHVAISRRAKKFGWTRSLKKQIRQRADELVNSECNSERNSVTAVLESETIDANARAIADVKLSHRRDIPRARLLSMNLLAELEHQAGVNNVDLLEQLGELLHNPDDKGIDKLNEIYQKVISLPNRVKAMKDLGEAMRVLILLERQAFNLDEDDGLSEDALKTVLHKISKTNGNAFMPVAQDPEFED